MARPMRHQINALICAVVLAHAIYWFLSGQAQAATAVRTSLVIAQAILGLIGAVWFWQRARKAT